jgi:putative tryptophan/tyrosine transport system substrate-binding protein
MKRREFITLLGGAAAWPVAARAQQIANPVVGYLYPGLPEAGANGLMAFRKGLSEAGYIEGRNLTLDVRWANGQYERIPELLVELIQHKVAVLVLAGGVAATLAAKSLTSSIPIVFSIVGDPVELGLVSSLNRPGGNITGTTDMVVELTAKQFSLLHELVPKAKRFALLVNPSVRAIAEPVARDFRAAAASVGREIELLQASNAADIAAAFAMLTWKPVDGLLVGPDTVFTNRRVQLLTLAARHGVATISASRSFAEAGGLMSYGPPPTERDRQAGVYTARILKGEKPAELPIQRPTKFELLINRQTADALGIDIPTALLARADEVIE